MQPRDEIARQERAMPGGAEHPGYPRRLGGGPIEAAEDAGERTGKGGHVVGNDLQAECSEARGIAVGIEDQSVALRRQTRDHALKDRATADGPHRLVAAAHAACEAAGEERAKSRWKAR